MDKISSRIAFLRGFIDATNAKSTPSVDYSGDVAKLAAWNAGKNHFDTLVKSEIARIEAALSTGNGFPQYFEEI